VKLVDWTLAPLLLTAAACQAAGGPAAGPWQGEEPTPKRQDPQPHDFMQGMDPDGRIPKVELPADIEHPERWRYLPEGRIQEGSFYERFLVSSFVVPLFFFESDIGAGGGVSVTDIDFRTQRRREFMSTNLTYTTEGQQNYSVLWRRWLDQRDIEGGGVIQEERSWIQAYFGYTKTLTRRFFGIGPGTREGDETNYTDAIAAVGFDFQSSLPDAGDDWVASAGVRLERRDLSDGFLSDVPDTDDVFPVLFDRDDDVDSLWVHGGLRYDTRDSQQNPYRGWSLGASVRAAPAMSGDRSGALYNLGGTYQVPVPGLLHDGGDASEENPPTDVLAFAAEVSDSSGDLPFWALPTLGGSYRLRGFLANRWTDEAAWFAVSEYRFAILPRGCQITERVRIERIGLALFYELGDVASGVRELKLSSPQDTFGVGLRINLERAAVFRFDVGFSDEGSEVTILYGLSF
jgi:outer membrane protein assembly factor BamA